MPRILIYTIFSLSTAFAHAQVNLCYSTVTRSIQTGVFNDGVSPTHLTRNQRHLMALQATTLIYQLADVGLVNNGSEFLAQHEAFERKLPQGYRFEHYFMNRRSSLKYMMLAPNSPTDPWIFAFAGSQGSIDWLSDISLGRGELADVQGLLYAFTNCEYTDGAGNAMGSRDWIITGHSLGGGLAESFAYSAQKRRMQAGLTPAPIELVTFNGFGGLDLVETSAKAAAPVVANLNAANYFVTGDVVSRIGVHLGPSYELVMPSAGILQAAKRHVIETVWSAAVPAGVPRFDQAPQVLPPPARTLNALKNHTSILSFLPGGQSDSLNYQLQHLNILEQALNIIATRHASASYDKQALRYIGDITLLFLKDEQTHAMVGLRPQVVQRLNNIMKRSTALLIQR